ncbi:MAG: cytochrome c [Gammaproteobacteria bacterium]|nr:cytochrome c [Gammaproteobacteria bacterium]
MQGLVQVSRGLAAALALQLGAAMAQAETDVERGEYLTRAADCVSCHTDTGGEDFAGGLAMKTPFGTIFTPNITPDDGTGIGKMTADQFYRVMHEGVGRHGEYLYPVMPFTFYTRMTREDVDAIYAYLRTVPPVTRRNRGVAFHFPFDIRATMLGWRELYFYPGTYQPDPSKSDAWNRGAYLVEGAGHCAACHSPRNVFGGIEKDRMFTGAEVDDWFALNLTDDLRSGLGAWSVDEIVTFLKTGYSKQKGVSAFGPMEEVVHNSLQYLTDDDLRAIAAYLHSIPARATSAAALSYTEPNRVEGAKVYLENCAMCHQPKGTGVPGAFPKLAGNPVVTAADPADLVTVIMKGIPGRGSFPAMPGFAERLGNGKVAAVVNYIRTSWGNDAAPGVTIDQVEQWRLASR